METLEQLVALTQNLFECDRDEMYYHLLEMCGELEIFFKFVICFPLWMEMGHSPGQKLCIDTQVV